MEDCPCWGTFSWSNTEQTALRASGATAVILVNMWSSGLGNQLAFLEHARAIGAL